MYVTFNNETTAFLINELEDMLENCNLSPGMVDDLSSFCNSLLNLVDDGSLVIVPDNDNIGDEWDEDSPDPSPIEPPTFIPA